MSDIYPRPPADEEEREAVRIDGDSAERCCYAVDERPNAPWPMWCTRTPGHAGRHIAGNARKGEIIAVWGEDAAPDHPGEPAEMVAGLARDLDTTPGDLARYAAESVRAPIPAVEISEALAHLDECAVILRERGIGNRLESVAATLRRLAGTAPAHMLHGFVGHRFQDGTMTVFVNGTCTVGRAGMRSLYVRADELRAEVGQRVTLRIEVDHG